MRGHSPTRSCSALAPPDRGPLTPNAAVSRDRPWREALFPPAPAGGAAAATFPTPPAPPLGRCPAAQASGWLLSKPYGSPPTARWIEPAVPEDPLPAEPEPRESATPRAVLPMKFWSADAEDRQNRAPRRPARPEAQGQGKHRAGQALSGKEPQSPRRREAPAPVEEGPRKVPGVKF